METGKKMETKSWKNFNIFEEAEKKRLYNMEYSKKWQKLRGFFGSQNF